MSVKPIVTRDEAKLPVIKIHTTNGDDGELEFSTVKEVLDVAIGLLRSLTQEERKEFQFASISRFLDEVDRGVLIEYKLSEYDLECYNELCYKHNRGDISSDFFKDAEQQLITSIVVDNRGDIYKEYVLEEGAVVRLK